VEKAFPVEVLEQIAVTHYLSLTDNAQLAFKQQKPIFLDSVITTTLEMESYLPQKGMSHWKQCENKPVMLKLVWM